MTFEFFTQEVDECVSCKMKGSLCLWCYRKTKSSEYKHYWGYITIANILVIKELTELHEYDHAVDSSFCKIIFKPTNLFTKEEAEVFFQQVFDTLLMQGDL